MERLLRLLLAPNIQRSPVDPPKASVPTLEEVPLRLVCWGLITATVAEVLPSIFKSKSFSSLAIKLSPARDLGTHPSLLVAPVASAHTHPFSSPRVNLRGAFRYSGIYTSVATWPGISTIADLNPAALNITAKRTALSSQSP